MERARARMGRSVPPFLQCFMGAVIAGLAMMGAPSAAASDSAPGSAPDGTGSASGPAAAPGATAGRQVLFEDEQAGREYDLTSPGRTSHRTGGAIYEALNPAQRFHVLFTESGFRLAPSEEAAGWMWSLTPSGFGPLGSTTEAAPLGSARVSSSANRIDYRYGALTASYTNAPRGLAAAFVVAPPPGMEIAKESFVLSLDAALAGGLHGRIAKDERGLDLVDAAGERVFGLSRLVATDSEGRDVPARLELALAPSGAPDGPGAASVGEAARTLRIVIEGGGTYPVRIDLLASPATTAAAGPIVSDQPPPRPELLLAPPANDTCGGAEVIPPGTGASPYLTAVTADITDATTAGDPGVPSCQGVVSRSIWYAFKPTNSATYAIQSCNPPTGTTVSDTVIAVYSAATCAGPFVEVACNDDNGISCTGLKASLSVALTSGTQYYIVVWKYDTPAPPVGSTAVQLQISAPPSNDRCSGVIPLGLNIPVAGTTFGGTNDYQLNAAACYTGIGHVVSTAPGRDVVYSFAPAASGLYTFRVTKYAGAVSSGGVLYVTDSCPAPPVTFAGSPPCLGAANRTGVGGGEEVLCLPVNAWQRVYVFVDEDPSSTGSSFTIEVNPCVRESEGNDGPAAANPIACGIEGTIIPAAEADFFALGSPPAGSRVFAMAETISSNNSDTQIRLTSTTDTADFDDDDGDVQFGGFSSSLGGSPVPAAPPAYIRVNLFNTAITAEPYRLYAVVQPPSASATAESEPNNALVDADFGANNYFIGNLAAPAPSTDVDLYKFSALAGDLIFLGLDGDPNLTNTPVNAALDLLDAAGTVLVSVNGSPGSLAVDPQNTRPLSPGLTSSVPGNMSESLNYRARASGTYYARVRVGPGATAPQGSGTYLLSISKNCVIGGGGMDSGLDIVPSIGDVVFEGIPPYFPSAPPEVVRLSSQGFASSQIFRDAQNGTTIRTELQFLDLHGNCPTCGGPLQVKLNTIQPSLGAIENVVRDGGGTFIGGDSFFDVFARVTAGGVELVNCEPFHVQAHIGELPPHNRMYEPPVLHPILLYDPNDLVNPRARIHYEKHWVDPELPPGDTDCFDTTFDADLQIFPPYYPGGYVGHIRGGGRTDVVRSNPAGAFPNQTVQTQITNLQITAQDPGFPPLGPVDVSLKAGGPQSLGNVQGGVGPALDPYRGTSSFFDVFVDVRNPNFGQGTTRPGEPVHITADAAGGNQLGTVPPGSGEFYRQPGGPTTIYLPDQVTPMGQISNVIHNIDDPFSWQGPPSGGDDCFDSWVTVKITLFDPFFPGGCMATLMVPGPFRVLRAQPFDPGNGRDVITTLFACALLQGSSTCGGAIQVRPSAVNASNGQIQSITPDQNFPADSFFDVFVDMDTGIGPLHTNAASHMTTTINTVPPGPGEIYYGPGTVIPLLNAGNVQVGEILEISHEIHGEIPCPCGCLPFYVFPLPKTNKTIMNVGIARGGAGVPYDVARGSILATAHNLAQWTSSFASASCVSESLSSVVSDATVPTAGRLQWYVSRDDFQGVPGTYNSCPGGVINRDPLIAICLP